MDEQAGCISVIVVVLLMLVVGFVGYCQGYESGHDVGHKAGQLDAMDGKWKWVKVKDADGHDYVVEKH